ncbi:MAG: type IV pilin, partial [Thermoplasmata archaeon]|nr:type IV pilin [Thermoplasmata archaeon]
MADKRIKRKIVWDQKGVSEIIGTILMLSITVVLFSSIIAYVGQMPAPKESFNVTLKCSLTPVNESDWDQGVWFNILHQGGKTMDDLFIRMFLAIDGTTLRRKVSDGLIDSKVLDGKWGLGETWSNVVSVVDTGAPFDSDSTYSITIINTEKNVLVWQETIGEEENVYSPVIKKAWIDSDLGTSVDDPGPISFTDDFKIFVHITDPEGNDPNYGLNQSDIWVNLSAIGLGILQLQDVWDVTDMPGDDVYVAVSDPPDRNLVPIGYHFFVFSASDYDGQKAKNLTQLFPVGMIVGENPQIVVRGNKLNPDGNLTNEYDGIFFSNTEPVNGDTITIYATILNHGGGSAEVNVSFYDGVESNATLIGTDYMLLHAQGERDARVYWLAAPGGVHNIIVNASLDPVFAAEKGVFDPYTDDNTNHTFLTVMPKILLVDDDGEINDRSDTDTASFMRASLEAADFEYDFVSVGAGSGPGYDYGDYPLQDYDVVIWMCGYQYSGTLTTGTEDKDDVANLKKYLDGASSAGNGGSLWFISQGFWDELVNPDLNAFAQNYLQVPTPLNPNNTIPTQLFGNDTHPVTDYFAENPIDCFTRPVPELQTPEKMRVWYWQSGPLDPDRIALYENNTAQDCYGMTYDSDDDGSNPTTDSRLFIQPWEFSRIENTAT